MKRRAFLLGPAVLFLTASWGGCGSDNGNNNSNNNNAPDAGNGIADAGSSTPNDSGGGGGDGGDAGTPTWSASGLNQANTISSLVIDRKNPNNVFAGISAGSTETGLWRSKDAGKTWAKVAGGLPSPQSFGLVAISPQTNTIFANPGVEGIWHSTNGGDNWTLSTSSVTDPGNTSGMLCHPTMDMTWIVTSQQGLYRSVNGGVSFTHPANTNLPLNQFNLGPLAFDGAKLYLGTSGHGIYVSTDNGDSWTQATSTNIPTTGATGDVVNLAATASRPGVLFVKTNGGLYRSTDSAATFTVLNPDKPLRYAGLVLDLAHTSTLYVSMKESSGDPGGIYESADDGATFKPLGKDFQAVNVVDISPTGTILVGTVGEGVWRRE